ncbi:MAG: chromosome partitioning protein [Parcubacteria group bacterium Licking1014_17]|nr:MAG: chromosome partitioning protein [Parcubacteria group bacterium Licking1014_17]
MKKTNSGLGRGLESLIPTMARKSAAEPRSSNIFYVETGKIKSNPSQVRRDFNKNALDELASSIKKYGVLQPLLVSKITEETEKGINVNYELIAGERRWRAAKLAGLPTVPVIIKDNIDEDRMKLEVALIENVQREDLNPMEEAEAYNRLAEEFKLTQKEISTKVGKSREVVANTIRLLGLPAEIKQALRSNKLSRTQARTLLAFKDEASQKNMFRQMLSGQAVIKDAEEEARKNRSGRKPVITGGRKFIELQDNLSKNLGVPVLIKNGASGGNIVIRFATLEELNGIVKLLLD